MSVVTVNQTVNDVQVVVGRVTHVLVGRQGPQGIQGIQGIPGAGLEPRGAWSGSTEYVARDLVEHGGSAYYTLSDVTGTEPPSSPWVLLVEKGGDGTDGAAATIAVGSVSTGEPDSEAEVTNSGSSSAAVLDFVIPRGDTGGQGIPGEAATVSVGSTTTGAAGSSASVTNSGTSSAAVLEFTIPRGDTGATGAAGDDGLSAYELAVQEGFEGSLEDWLTSLIGEPGEAGQDGTGISAGSGAPSTDGEVAGDLYIDTSSGDLYEWS